MFKEVGHGEQAIVGYYKTPTGQSQFLKISRDNSFITQHEANIAACLGRHDHLRQFFCGARGLTTIQVRAVPRIESGDDICEEPDSIPRYGLQLDYIPDASNLNQWVVDHKKSPTLDIFPLVRQIMCIVRLAQEAVAFTHYDLHTDNILLRPVAAPPKTVKIFRFADGSIKCVQNVSVEPVIIDFGRAYCNELEDTAVNIELLNTNSGLFSVLPDMTFDPLFFLFKCATDCKSVELKSLANNLRKYTRHLDQNGWWKSDQTSALDRAASLVRVFCAPSALFSADLEQCLVIMSHLCVIPLERSSEHKPASLWPYYFDKFIKQWRFFEKWFTNPVRLQYFLCFFVSVLNVWRQDFFDTSRREMAQGKIVEQLENFMGIECAHVWSSRGLDWYDLIRCAYNAGKMLEQLLADVIAIQHDEYCQHTREATWDNLYAAIPSDIPLNYENGGELYDSTTRQVSQLTRDQVADTLKQIISQR